MTALVCGVVGFSIGYLSQWIAHSPRSVLVVLRGQRLATQPTRSLQEHGQDARPPSARSVTSHSPVQEACVTLVREALSLYPDCPRWLEQETAGRCALQGSDSTTLPIVVAQGRCAHLRQLHGRRRNP